jgi:hypothetical protein
VDPDPKGLKHLEKEPLAEAKRLADVLLKFAPLVGLPVVVVLCVCCVPRKQVEEGECFFFSGTYTVDDPL